MELLSFRQHFPFSFYLPFSVYRTHILSTLTTNTAFHVTYYLSKFILWWCSPPALPLPPGCFLCFPGKDTQSHTLEYSNCYIILTHTTMPVAHMPSELARLLQPGWLKNTSGDHVNTVRKTRRNQQLSAIKADSVLITHHFLLHTRL